MFGATASSLGYSTTSPALAADSVAVEQDNDEVVEVYFGCGCFWHVQHECVEAKRTILGRSNDLDLTSRAGYAGGTTTAGGKVCYHNALNIADYGSLGHAEVVKLNIPASTFPAFAEEYCRLFDKNGYRPDQLGDRGPEYQNLVGIPGGTKSQLAKQLVDVSIRNGDKLDFAKGKGDDPDRRALVFIMDTADFPFFVAEQYHQFHDGFNFGENYPNKYNALAKTLADSGVLGVSKCPNGLIGIGALGL
jgi:peptide methionine sulfoxide reductase MsrA